MPVRPTNRNEEGRLVVSCGCGTEVELDRYGDTECPDCGQEYNQAGQMLQMPPNPDNFENRLDYLEAEDGYRRL